MYTLTTIETFVGQGACRYPGGIYGNAHDVAAITLGSQLGFISQLGYGGQLMGIGQPPRQATRC